MLSISQFFPGHRDRVGLGFRLNLRIRTIYAAAREKKYKPWTLIDKCFKIEREEGRAIKSP